MLNQASTRKNTGAAYIRFTVKTGLDEDAGYAIETDRYTLLAVFDGMGGMGSRRFVTMRNLSSAYLASHFYARVLEKDFFRCLQEGCFDGTFNYAKHLGALFTNEGQYVKKRFLDQEPSSIVGSMVKALPSTAAIALVNKESNHCIFIWAGDSRGYFLSENGLYQLTNDNVKMPQNAFDSLYRDAPMNNFINADKPFKLFSRGITTKRPGVFLVATDGAFACLPSPMHFEGLLLNALAKSKDSEDWLLHVKADLLPQANDDVTVAIQPVGFESHDAMKSALDKRRQYLERTLLLSRPGGMDIQSLRDTWQKYHTEMYGTSS